MLLLWSLDAAEITTWVMPWEQPLFGDVQSAEAELSIPLSIGFLVALLTWHIQFQLAFAN